MQITFTGHHMDITQALRDFATEKLDHLQHYFERITSINVTFGVEKLSHIAEATVRVPGEAIHAKSESNNDMYSAIDTLINKLKRQLKRHKEKENDRR